MTALFAGLRAFVYGTGFVLLWGWLALSVRRFDRLLHVELPGWLREVGAGLMALGGVVALSCIAVFAVRGRGTPAPFDPPREFVVIGPYRRVRNPMYVGALVVLAGFGLWHRSLAMTLFPVVAWLIVHAFVVLVEEPGLERRFGDSYRDYKRRVRRWVPTIS